MGGRSVFHDVSGLCAVSDWEPEGRDALVRELRHDVGCLA